VTTAGLHVFAGILFLFASVLAMTSTHLVIVRGLEKSLSAVSTVVGAVPVLGGALGNIKRKLEKHVQVASQKPTEDRVAEWFNYAALFIATVLLCVGATPNSPYAYLIRVRIKAFYGLCIFFWVIIAIQFTVMTCFMLVGRVFAGSWERRKKGYKLVSTTGTSGHGGKHRKAKHSGAEEDDEEEDDDEEDEEDDD